jgi:hypothetical protein
VAYFLPAIRNIKKSKIMTENAFIGITKCGDNVNEIIPKDLRRFVVSDKLFGLY